MNRLIKVSLLLTAWMMISFPAAADEAITFNFQGRLSNALGNPVPDGNYQMRFFIYADSIGGTPLWTELHSAVPINGGQFNIDLGSVAPCSLGIPSLANIYLATQVGAEPPMARRLRISTAPNSGVARRIYGDLESSPGALRFLDDGSEYMGIEPSPWRAGGDLIMKSGGGPNTMVLGSDGTISLFDNGTEYMGVDPVPWHSGGDLTMYDGGVQTMVFGSNGTMSMLDDGSEYMGVEPSPFHAGGDIIMRDGGVQTMALGSNGTMSMLDDGSEYMGIEPVPWHSGGDLTMYDGGLQTMVLGSNGTISMLDDGSEYMGIEPSPWHAGGDLIMRDATGGQTIILSSLGNISIGTSLTSNILTVRQYATANPIADAWTIYSSRRWKTNIETLKDPLAKVMALRGVSYDWTENGKHDIGLIAEEVGQVVPEVVAYEDNGVDAKSVDYARLTALLIEAVKEQQKTIEQLKSEINELKIK